MNNWEKYIIRKDLTIRQALTVINDLGESNCVLFVINESGELLGTVTDGDIRRGLIANAQLEHAVVSIANKSFRKILNGGMDLSFIKKCREDGITVLPTVDEKGIIQNIVRVTDLKTVLPLHAVIMAGGKGERLLPLTKSVPKPMLIVGEKPIIEHNIDQLRNYGVHNFHISINYLGHIISNYFKDGKEKGVNIQYLEEEKPMGTLGCVSFIKKFAKDDVLVMNADLLTNIDFEDFYNEFKQQNADMAVATIPYHVDLPYAIMELDGVKVTAFKEKPRYTYFANAGIYLVKASMLKLVPENSFYNATDLMDLLIQKSKKLMNYPILGYWLDIGKPEDFARAQKDISHLHL
jgi:dTDP-glucose pyrophosphorylase